MAFKPVVGNHPRSTRGMMWPLAGSTPASPYSERRLGMKYRNKPVVIEAEQWLIGKHENIDGVCEKAHDGVFGGPHVHTLEGRLNISHGDWIITGVKGERYPCKPDIFEATYELV